MIKLYLDERSLLESTQGGFTYGRRKRYETKKYKEKKKGV